MKTILLLILSLSLSLTLNAQNNSDEIELTQMLHTFLDGASKNDPIIHDNFWAEDLIYTSSSGKRFGKKEIMVGFKDKSEDSNENPATVFTAEDIMIQKYGEMAIVAFKMKADSDSTIQYYLNSGTFHKRDGKWQVVNWQATISGEPIKK